MMRNSHICILFLFLFFFLQTFPVYSGTEKTEQGEKKALFWEKAEDKNVRCLLCPKACLLKPGQKGFCRARKNINGILYTMSYARPVAMHIDPVEKKPFFHVYPGTRSFSLATAGCNMRCKFCQNWEISQLDPEKVYVNRVSAGEIAAKAESCNCRTIAFTYTEPTVFYEYMLDIAEEAEKKGIECVMHSNGLINEEPLRRLADHLTAANIDLKGFSEDYYLSMCAGRLSSVLNTLKILKEKNVWLEITTLLIPGENDSEQEITSLCRWIRKNLGPDVPLHFSRFYPMYKLKNLPPTPVSTLTRAKQIAEKEGLNFIYIGNVPGHQGENTFCPVCGELLIKRTAYTILENKLENGCCPFCGKKIPGLWD